jgi:deoxyribonuclease-1
MKLLTGLLITTILASNAYAMGSKSKKRKNKKDPITKPDTPAKKVLAHSFYTEKGYLQDIEASKDPKALLNKILNSKHSVAEGRADTIVENCEGILNCKYPVRMNYKRARIHMYNTHLENYKDGSIYIKDIYCLKEYTVEDFGPTKQSPSGKPIGKNLIPDGTILNAEHVWPKNRFLENDPNLPKKQKKGHPLYKVKEADMHILYPSHSQENGLRQNWEFGDVDVPGKKTKCADTKVGKITLADGTTSSKTYYQPPTESKGNVARVVFYFSIRYNVYIHPEEEAFLKAWHKADPVDEMEIHRNETFYGHTNVRNPFIDMPELADVILDF